MVVYVPRISLSAIVRINWSSPRPRHGHLLQLWSDDTRQTKSIAVVDPMQLNRAEQFRRCLMFPR